MWIDPANTLDLIIKGLIIGMIASAPMGPVGVLVIQRTLNKGRWFGFVTGIGAAFSDLIYAFVTCLGMSFILDFIQRPDYMLYLKIGGSLILFLFGLYTYFAKPAPFRPPSKNKGTLAHNMLTGFLVTLGNPLIVFLFMVLYARFDFIISEHYIERALGGLAIALGALLWWFTLTAAVNKIRARFNKNTIMRINRVIGVVVMTAAIFGCIYTLFIL